VAELSGQCPGEQDVVDQICHASNGNFALGNARFGEELAMAQRVTPGKSGRPKVPATESKELFE